MDDTEDKVSVGAGEGSKPRKGKRRAARYVSEQDQKAIADGRTPSWDEKVKVEGDSHANDARLLRDVPPHW